MSKTCGELATLTFSYDLCVLRIQCNEDDNFGTYEFMLYETVLIHRNGGILIKDKISQLFIASDILDTYYSELESIKTQRDACVERLLGAGA